VKTKKLSVLITLVALIGTFTASLPLIVIEANAGGPTVEMEVNVPPFCGLAFVPPFDGILTFPTTINFAVSDPRSVTLSNTGNGAGEVSISGSSVTHPTTTNLVGDWLDDNGGLLWEVFRTRFASSDIAYTQMTPVSFIPQTFIEVLVGQDQAERIFKVRPFDQTGQDNVLGHQIMDLEIDCAPARSCPGGQVVSNGDCVPAAECVETPQICDDNNICTADFCDEVIGCSNTSVADGPTGGGACTVSGAFGVCADGVESCVSGGLSCVGPAPTAEVCDGLDNNCDGSIDEGLDLCVLNG